MGFININFPSSENQYVILDLEHRDKLLDYKINWIDKDAFEGYRFSQAWATNQKLFYHMKFSKPIEEVNYFPEKNPTKVALKFKNPKNEPSPCKNWNFCC